MKRGSNPLTPKYFKRSKTMPKLKDFSEGDIVKITTKIHHLNDVEVTTEDISIELIEKNKKAYCGNCKFFYLRESYNHNECHKNAPAFNQGFARVNADEVCGEHIFKENF
jgi:hypothetical protein